MGGVFWGSDELDNAIAEKKRLLSKLRKFFEKRSVLHNGHPVLFPNRWPEALSSIGINFALNWAEARTLRAALWGETGKGEGVIDKRTFVNGTLPLASFQAILR